MAHRILNTLIICCWLASMSWLVVAKIVPAMVGGDPPDYRSRLDAERDVVDSWRIKWNDQTIGQAASRVVDGPNGGTELRSIVHFEDLPLAAITRQLLGVMAVMVKPLFDHSGDLRVEMLIASRMSFDGRHQLKTMSTVIDLGDMRELLRLDGDVDDKGRLEVVATLAEGGRRSEGLQIFRHEIDLPPRTLINDSLAPRSELRELRVGQSWTLPVYRAFPPNQPIQIVEATVERHDILFWEGIDVETKMVVYRSDSGSNIQATREVLGREWVSSNGMVLRQEVTFAGHELRFERLGRDAKIRKAELLDEDRNPRLWKPRGLVGMEQRK